MTSAVVTPSGVPVAGSHGGAPVRAVALDGIEMTTYRLRLPAPAPPELRVSLELGKEASGVWAHIPEIDVSAEGDDLSDAFYAVIAAAREWLSYVRDGEIELAPELNDQARYVPLLDAPVFSWFRDFSFVE